MPTVQETTTEPTVPLGQDGPEGERPSVDVLVRWLAQEEQRAERVRARFGRLTLISLISLTVALPLLFLALTGGVSLGGWRRLTQEPPEETKARVEAATRKALLEADGGDEEGDPVAADIHRYVTQDLPPLKAQEKKTLDSYWRIVNDTYTDDRTAVHAVHDKVVPAYTQYLDHLESVRVATDELYGIHMMKLEIGRRRKNAFDRIAHADDIELVPADGEGWRVEASHQLEEARNIEAAFTLRLADLQHRHPFKPRSVASPPSSQPSPKARKAVS